MMNWRRCLPALKRWMQHLDPLNCKQISKFFSPYLTAADDGISGLTTSRRAGFNQMISDCLDGQVDLILTKSISRFARNTVDTVTTIRKLKEKGVAVYFEKKDFYTVKMPINAVNTALSKGSWCLVGV